MLHTTLNLLKRAGACGQKVGCQEGYDKLRHHLGEGWKKDQPISLTVVLESNGLDDALWCLRAVLPEESGWRDKLARLLACDYAEHVAHLWVPLPGVDWKPSGTIAVARRYAHGQATEEERAAARAAAWDAAGAAARAAAWDAQNETLLTMIAEFRAGKREWKFTE